jgi:hypothetical protein
MGIRRLWRAMLLWLASGLGSGSERGGFGSKRGTMSGSAGAARPRDSAETRWSDGFRDTDWLPTHKRRVDKAG